VAIIRILLQQNFLVTIRVVAKFYHVIQKKFLFLFNLQKKPDKENFFLLKATLKSFDSDIGKEEIKLNGFWV
jgi:hypothetical protein